jgi:integrase/recombinase XerC
VSDFLEHFTAYLQSQDRSAHTVAAYTRDVIVFFTWLPVQLGKAVPLVEVTPFDVQKYRDYLVTEGRKPAGINRALAALRVFFAWVVQTDQASTNPARDVQGIQQARRNPKALTAQEVYRLQREAAVQRQLAQAKAGEEVLPAVVDAIRDEALLSLLLYTGLRVSECAALRVDDVVLNGKSGKVIVRSGKGRKYREIPLHKEARKALTAYLDVRPGDQSETLFLGQRGALGARGIQFRIAALGDAAGVPVTPHVLRHTFATKLLREAKADLVTVASLMGHSSVATTAIYTQPSETDLAKAVAGLG